MGDVIQFRPRRRPRLGEFESDFEPPTEDEYEFEPPPVDDSIDDKDRQAVDDWNERDSAT